MSWFLFPLTEVYLESSWSEYIYIFFILLNRSKYFIVWICCYVLNQAPFDGHSYCLCLVVTTNAIPTNIFGKRPFVCLSKNLEQAPLTVFQEYVFMNFYNVYYYLPYLCFYMMGESLISHSHLHFFNFFWVWALTFFFFLQLAHSYPLSHSKK